MCDVCDDEVDDYKRCVSYFDRNYQYFTFHYISFNDVPALCLMRNAEKKYINLLNINLDSEDFHNKFKTSILVEFLRVHKRLNYKETKKLIDEIENDFH